MLPNSHKIEYNQHMSTITTIMLAFVVLWVLGLFVFNIAGYLIHLLIIAAVLMFLIRIIQGKNPFK